MYVEGGGYVLLEGGYVGGGVCWMLDTLRGYVGGGGGARWRGGEVSWGRGESGTSTREDRSKTAQKPLKSCLKNRSKITARNERFLSGFLSKIRAV